jgi:hypothetical protein
MNTPLLCLIHVCFALDASGAMTSRKLARMGMWGTEISGRVRGLVAWTEPSAQTQDEQREGQGGGGRCPIAGFEPTSQCEHQLIMRINTVTAPAALVNGPALALPSSHRHEMKSSDCSDRVVVSLPPRCFFIHTHFGCLHRRGLYPVPVCHKFSESIFWIF